MVATDVVSLYPSITHDVGLEALRRVLDDGVNKKIGTEDLIKMVEFVLKNNYFEFNGKVKQHLYGTVINTKFGSPYACIFMNQVETEFFESSIQAFGMVSVHRQCIFYLGTLSRKA